MEPELLDARATRLDRTIVAIAILAGFVFEEPWVLPVVAVSTTLGAVLGLRGAPLVRGFHLMIGPRLEAPTTFVDPVEWRFATGLIAAGLAVATLLAASGLRAIAWAVGLVVAVVAALDATTGIGLGGWARRHWGPRG